MAETPLDMNVYTQTTIPNALAELMDNHSKMQQISNYCKSAYVPGGADTAQIYEQTQSYAKNALLNVAYHIQTIGTHLTTLLQLQSNEIDKINIEIQTLTQRINMIHDTTGSNVFNTKEATKSYKSTLKEKKIEVESSKPPVKYVHKPINYNMGNGAGANGSAADLSNSGSSSSGGLPPPPPNTSSTSTPSYQSPTNYSPQQTFTPPPIQKAPQTPARGPAAPPSLSVPPSIPARSAPPPSFDAPPPPPALSHDSLPPPPPSFDAFSLPPPPPSSFDLPPPPARPVSQYEYDLSSLPPPPPPQ
eukprot:gene4993-6217_t